MAKILMTGATGFIGRYLYNDLVKSGHEVWAIVRGDDPCQRLANAIKTVAHSCDVPINAIRGNIHEENCGISFYNSSQFDMIVHGAGMPIFDESKKEEVAKTNIQGTSNIINLANKLNITNIANLSTVYSCGKADCKIKEDKLECHQWNNTYEMTKHEAETLLYDWSARRPAHNLMNFRLPIVSGAYHATLRNYASLSTYIEFMSAFYYFGGTGNNLDIEIFGDPNLPIYIEPVDVVSSVMAQLIGCSKSRNKTFHVICSNQKTVRWWVMTGLKYLNVSGPRITLNPTDSSATGRMIRRAIKQFNPYVSSQPKLEQKNIRLIFPSVGNNSIDENYIKRLMDYSVVHLYKEPKD